MNRLIIESSTTQASIALFFGKELLAEESFPSGRGPHSRFFSILETMLEQVETVEELIVGVGPGSYSGIRIGISAIIGLQLARGIVAHGIHSAFGYSGTDFQVILDARGTYIYSAIRANLLAEGPTHCNREELEGKIDPFLPIFSPNSIPDFEFPQTFPLASILGERLTSGNITADLPLQPLYLKAPHITLPKTK